MRVLILGATGRTGIHVLHEALKEGFEINCLTRNRNSIDITDDKLRVFEGCPSNMKNLDMAISDCDAIISVLNISRTSDFPWAKLRTPSTFLSDVIENVIAVSNQRSIIRVIVCSAWGVSETIHDIPFWFRSLIRQSNIGVAYANHEVQEVLLMKTKLDWTIVRPSGLTNSKKKENIKESYSNNPKPSLSISRLSVAKYMVSALSNPKLIHKAVTISAS
jgi:putative NADH-flavin reductase